MPIDAHDQRLLDASGNAQDIMYELYGRKLNKNNASKYLTGARIHVNYKQENQEETEAPPVSPETKIMGDGTVLATRLIEMTEAESQDQKTVMKKMGYDPGLWKLNWVKSKQGFWNTSMKLRKIEGYDAAGRPIYRDEPHKMTNYTYKCEISISPLAEGLSSDIIAQLFSELQSPELEEYKYNSSGNLLLEVPIMDVHLGKLAWNDETGHNYKLSIAKKLYKDVVKDFLGRIKQYNLDIAKVVFPIGQDFFHFDTDKQTTTAGTQMDSDTRWQKMYDTGIELVIWAIEQFREIAPVDVIYVASNHDKMMSYCLTQNTAAWFRNCDSVTVDTSPAPQKYYDWGKCLIGYSHGDKESKRIDTLMQADVPKLWGKSIFREWHLGHLHSEQVREVGGVIVRHMSSITSLDSWHTEHGYRTLRKAQAIVWDKENGKELTMDVNVTA